MNNYALKHVENMRDYAEYERRFSAFLEAEEIEGITSDPDSYASFSWHPCNCCKRPLGGDRHTVQGYKAGSGETYIYEVCSDCLYYGEYGQLDDMTMMNLERHSEKEARENSL